MIWIFHHVIAILELARIVSKGDELFVEGLVNIEVNFFWMLPNGRENPPQASTLFISQKLIIKFHHNIVDLEILIPQGYIWMIAIIEHLFYRVHAGAKSVQFTESLWFFC